MQRGPATEHELRSAYGSSCLHALGISFDRAMTAPDLLALLSLLACRDRHRAQKARQQPVFVSRIERTAGRQPDLFNDLEPTL